MPKPSACQCTYHSLLLTTAKAYAIATNTNLVTFRELRKVRLQSTSLDHLAVPGGVERG